MTSLRSIGRTAFTWTLSAAMAVSWTAQIASAQSVGSDATRAIEYTNQIQRSMLAIEDGRRQAPRDRWDPQYVVDTVGVDPAGLYAFVRDNVAWVPYRGKLRGPVGVLMDRTANSLDTSLLLADLLSRAGHQVRLAHATLDDETVERVWSFLAETTGDAAQPETGNPGVSSETVQSIVAGDAATPGRTQTPFGPDAQNLAQMGTVGPSDQDSMFGGTMGGSGSMFEAVTGGPGATAATDEEAAELYELDRDAARKTLEQAATDRSRLADELEARVVDQGSRLLSMFSASAGEQAGFEQARARSHLADHWWVQLQDGGNWIDYDTLSLEIGQSLAQPAETMRPGDVPVQMSHRVGFRVVGERLIDGKLQEGVAFEHVFEPSELFGKRISLRHLPLLWPADWAAITPDDVQEKLFAALYTQREWMPALTVGTEAFQQSSLLDTGAVNPDPQPQQNPFLQIAFPVAGKVGRVVDLFDDLLKESPDEEGTGEPELAGDAPRADGELTAEWLEYVIVVPGEEPKTVRREVFDILGPALRRGGDLSGFRMDEDKRLARAAGQMTETDLLILPSWPAPEFLADMTAAMALANKPLMNEFTRDPFGKAPPNAIELFSKMSGVAGPAYLYASLRSQVGLTSGKVFVDRPQIVAQHGILTRVGPGELTAKAAIDVVENGVGVDPFEEDPFFNRVLQGVADTNAEALAMPEGGKNVGEAFKQAGAEPEWTIFFPEDRDLIQTLGLSPDMTARVLADLDAGMVIVSPSGKAREFELAGWWRVDPSTGDTLGMGNRGWGSVLVEYAFYLTIQVMLAQISCMAYTAAAEEKIRGLTAEQGRDKVKTWARNCVSQALLETVAGLSTSWISSRFLEGAKVPTWNDRAKGNHSFPNGPRPHINPPHDTPRDHESTPRNHDNTPQDTRNDPRPDPRSNPRTKPNNDLKDGDTIVLDSKRKGTRRDPLENEAPHPPQPQDRRAQPPCHADAGFVKFAALSVSGQGIMRDFDVIEPLELAAGAGCNSNDSPRKPHPRPTGAEKAEYIKEHTDRHLDANRKENEARREFEKNPTPENAERHRQAVVDADKARRAEMKAWWEEGGYGSPPGFRPGAREGYDGPPVPTPGHGPQGGPENAAPHPQGKDPAMADTAPQPAQPPRPAEATPPDPARTQPMPERPQGNPATADTVEQQAQPRPGSNTEPIRPVSPIATTGPQQARPAPSAQNGSSPDQTGPQPQAPRTAEPAPIDPSRTQPMESRPPRNDAERGDAIRNEAAARQAAQQRYADAEQAYQQNRTPENYDAFNKANDAYNRAHMAEIDAWNKAGGRGFPPRSGDGPIAAADPTPRPPGDVTGPQPQVRPAGGNVTGPQDQTGPQPQAPRPAAAAPPDPARTQPMPERPPTPLHNDAERLQAIRPEQNARLAAEQSYADAELAYDQNKTPENLNALDRANDAYNRAHMAEIDAWNKAGGRGFPPREQNMGSAPALAQPIVERAPKLSGVAPGEGATNSTLAMGLGALAGAIKKGP